MQHTILGEFSLLLAGTMAGAVTENDIRSAGAFGFPQRSATVLCETPDLRFSVCSDGQYFFAQAILWKDGGDAVGSTDDGRRIGDWSILTIDADADSKVTPYIDRSYSLNPWPGLPGLHYSVPEDENYTNSGLTGDSQGRGSIQYVDPGDGTRVRVDTYLIPLAELQRKPGDRVRFAYWAKSPQPELIVNSVGYAPPPEKERYWSHHLQHDSYHRFTLGATADAQFDEQQVPEGRGSIAIEKKKEPPRIGATVGEPDGPPEVSAGAWLNWSGASPPTLALLRGKVVVVEFWATWCAPCVAGIPHLNQLHTAHAKDGLVILSLTRQERGPVAEFVAKKGAGMAYTVGVESEMAGDYGVSGIPYSFVIGRDGKLVWAGLPAGEDFDEAVLDALKAK